MTARVHLAINAWFWDQPTTGSGQTVRHLVPALVEGEPALDVTLVGPPWLMRDAADLPPRVTLLTASCRPGNMGKLWFEQVTFPRLCSQIGADLAHVPYFASPLRPRVPTLATIHDLIPMVLPQYRGGPSVRLYTALVAAAATRARLVFTDSEASRRDILAHLRVPAGRVRALHLAPAPHYRPVADADTLHSARRKYRLPDRFVLWLSGFDVRKNAAALLHAYTWVAVALGDECPLVMAGTLPAQDSRFFPDPRRISARLDLGRFVHYPGHIDEHDKPAVYSAATVFVYPSRYEGFGLPVLEAMACGTPVVTSDAASLPELAGNAAFQVHPDDTRGLAAAIVSLSNDQTLHAEMRRRGIARAAAFSWEKTARATLDAYREVLTGA